MIRKYRALCSVGLISISLIVSPGFLLGKPLIAAANEVPVVTVNAVDDRTSESSSDTARFEFRREGGDMSLALTVHFRLSGGAEKWNDYRRPEGDMPVSMLIPAGAAVAAMEIYGVDDELVEGVEEVVVTLTEDAGYLVGAVSAASAKIEDGDSVPTFSANAPSVASEGEWNNMARPPEAGDHGMRILTPTLLELTRINGKDAGADAPDSWDFVDAQGRFLPPPPESFVILVDGVPSPASAVGFKRRVRYAPLKERDLRIGNALYLELNEPLSEGQSVEALSPGALLWPENWSFFAKMDPSRWSPAIHVNQTGYQTGLPKKAMAGYFLGNLGEMAIAENTPFKLVEAGSGGSVFEGVLTPRRDIGYTTDPIPYQAVMEADFSAFETPGEYRLFVEGLGASPPFRIGEGVSMAFARTYALGLYHQRCGAENALPHTRHTHEACHVQPAEIPAAFEDFQFTWNTIQKYNANYASNPRHVAPRMEDPETALYPFIHQGPIDVSCGHHDAGDYSKYTINSAALIHALVFSADAFPGVEGLDNLGLPESGDGISDLLQEAKWEADFLAKLQDADGGFYFLVYPKNRAYESDALPDDGDPQVVWPKNTSATAAAVAALAQCASSPAFKTSFPETAARYLEQAEMGWSFLVGAIEQHGKDGAYQKITHYGDTFMHDDELAWAACELYLATGDTTYRDRLADWFDPSDAGTYRWGWWRMFDAYGNAVRSYAFGVRTGRLTGGQLNGEFMEACRDRVLAAGKDARDWSGQSAYATSFPPATKRARTAGWYFSNDQAFDISVANLLESADENVEAIVGNLNYEAGCNPVNVCYLTGMGRKRQTEIVHQYAQNDARVLPPSGIPLGNIQAGFAYLNPYGTELRELSFPSDSSETALYPYYDRWGDSFNVTTEFVHPNMARGLGSLACLAADTPLAGQAWNSASGEIVIPGEETAINQPVSVSFQSALNTDDAIIVWEARDQAPFVGGSFTFTPVSHGEHWIEAEVLLPDGRRVFARNHVFTSNGLPNVSVAAVDGEAGEAGPDKGVFRFTRTGSAEADLAIQFQLSGSAAKWTDYRRPQGDMPVSLIIPAGESEADLEIVPVDDSLVEGVESLIVTVMGSDEYNAGEPTSASIEISDDDSPLAPSNSDSNSKTFDPEKAIVPGETVETLEGEFVSIHGIARLPGGEYEISWESEHGRTYCVLEKDRLSQSEWRIVSGPLIFESRWSSWVDSAGERPGQWFYAVYRIFAKSSSQ